MQVQMKTTDYFSPDGITSYLYQNDVRYDVPDPLGERMVANDQAVQVDLDREARERAQPLGEAGTARIGEAGTSSPGAASSATDRKAAKGSKDRS